jgi:hypothetical protein
MFSGIRNVVVVKDIIIARIRINIAKLNALRSRIQARRLAFFPFIV